MIRNIIYAVCGFGSLGMLLFAAPSGALLTGTPQTGKVTTDTSDKNGSGRRTIRGGPAFIWLGGGYQGGK
ncbi:MAG: hypothetical protein ACRBN8_11160 [Nannocystales bacterium]